MQRIEKQYVKESIRIIDSYNEQMDKIDKIQALLETKKESFVEIKDQIDVLTVSDEPELAKQQQLLEIINVYDKEVNDFQKRLEPYLKNIEELKKDSSNLYALLKEKHVGVSDDALQKQLHKQIAEIKNPQN